MGNSSSSKRDRTYSSDSECASPCREERFFEFGKSRRGKFLLQPSLEECEDVPDAFKVRGDLGASSGEFTHFPAVFKWNGGGKDVFVSGTFSDWKPIRMVKSHEDFALILDIPEGDHEYKFQVDGRWVHDPKQPTVNNDLGTKNNTVTIRKADFEVFEALALDDVSRSGTSTSSVADEPFSQEIPSDRNEETYRSVMPPLLPPQLLEVILNKELAVMRSDPTQLPEPNHVMLNHVYALSIREGVMVLSATFRFRKKYVTTLMYKPI